MKISVIGHVIETKNIYDITPIKGDNCWSYLKDDPNDNGLTHSSFLFKIKFFNKKSLTVELCGGDLYPKDDDGESWWVRDYDKKLLNLQDKINEIRNEVIGYWNESSSEIPKIEVEKKEKKKESKWEI